MFQIDNSTAVAAIPAPTPAGTAGYFTDGNPATGVSATIVPAEFMNMLMMENMNVLAAASIAPAKGQYNQLSLAIAKIVQGAAAGAATETTAGILKLSTNPLVIAGDDDSTAVTPLKLSQKLSNYIKQATETAFGWLKIATQALVNAGVDDTAAVTSKKLAAAVRGQVFTAFTAGGTATAVTLTPVPAITGYAIPLRFRVLFSVASGTNPTINVSGVGPINLKQYDSSGSKVAAVFAAGQLADVEYDGTDMVLLDQLPNNSSTTPNQFDNSLRIATTAFVKSVGIQYSNLFFLVGATTMGATYAGSLSVCNSASAFGVTLPLLSSMAAGSTIAIWNFGAGLVTVSPAGSDILYAPPNASATFTIPQGACIVLGASPVANSWYLIGGPQATETILGSSRIATQAQVDNGTGDTATITPQKLKSGFLASYGVNGYIKLPSWLFGLTIQWGTVAGSNTTQSFPLAFATSCAYLGATVQVDSNSPASDGERQVSALIVSNSQFRLRNGTANGLTLKWLALGF